MGRDKQAKKLPMLNNIRIASPCSESWDGMVGDDKVRFCGGCLKNVYNLSAMTEGEAQELITEKEGDACVRLYRRKDGTVITSDCPVGVRRKRVTKIAAAALAFGGAGLALASMQTPEPQPCEIPTRTTRTTSKTTTKNVESSWLYNLLGGEEEPAEVEMGDMVEMGEVEPMPRPRMGKIAPAHSPRPNGDKVPQL
jgi:hypothetical protein